MRKYYYSVVLAFLTALLNAQAPPQAVNYQAVARDGSGNILPNTTLCLRFTVNDGVNPGTPEYQEVHLSVTTNQFGLFTLEIGQGTPTFGYFCWNHLGNGQ